MNTSVKRRLCASAVTGRWSKKVGSATESAELETSVLCWTTWPQPSA